MEQDIRGDFQSGNAPVYTRCNLLVADGPQAPSDRRGCVRCTSRRWRLLVYTGREGHPGGAAPGGRTAAVRQYHHRALAVGGSVRS